MMRGSSAGWWTGRIVELTDEDITRIADTYHAWRTGEDDNGYADIPGFCKSASLMKSAGTAMC